MKIFKMSNKAKRNLVITGLLTFTVLFGCSQSDEGVSADSVKLFSKVSNEVRFDVFKHDATGCYYTVSDSGNNYGITTQMLKPDGLPYCD